MNESSEVDIESNFIGDASSEVISANNVDQDADLSIAIDVEIEAEDDDDDNADIDATENSSEDNENNANEADESDENEDEFIEVGINDNLEEVMEQDRIRKARKELEKKQRQEERFSNLNKIMELNKLKWRRLRDDLPSLYEDKGENKLIVERMTELESMCSYYTRPDYILYMLPPNIYDYVKKLMSQSKEEYTMERRQGWEPIQFFKYVARMSHIITNLVENNRKYFIWRDDASNKSNLLTGRSNGEVNADNEDDSTTLTQRGIKSKNTVKYSLNKPLRMILVTNPRFRTQSAIQQILWFNRTTGAFSDLFPKDVEQQLAQLIGYEIFDDNRIIRYHGKAPEKMYYILKGKLEIYKVYSLSEGKLHKLFRVLNARQTTDFEEFKNRAPSEYYFVARGTLEVLTLHHSDYLKLTEGMNTDSVQQFLNQMPIFKDVPVTTDVIQNKSISIDYYKNDKVISKNAIHEPNIFVVKSGQVTVARLQNLDDTIGENVAALNTTKNHKKRGKGMFERPEINQLGYKREKTHATAMMGLPNRQRQFKTTLRLENLQKPQLPHKRSIQNLTAPEIHIETESSDDETSRQSGEEDQENNEKMPQLNRSKTVFVPSADKYNQSLSLVTDLPMPSEVIGTRTHTQITKTLVNKSPYTEKSEKLSYVKLDQLSTGDICGLELIEDNSKENLVESQIVLISEGAEIVTINKRFLLTAVDNNTLLEMKKLTKMYISEDEARSAIKDETKWNIYKKVLMRRMVEAHS